MEQVIIMQICNKCKNISTHLILENTVNCKKCGNNYKTQNDFKNRFSYDSCTISPNEVREYVNDDGKIMAYILLEGTIEGKNAYMNTFNNIPNAFFIPTRKNNGKGKDVYFQDNETDFTLFKSEIDKSLEKYSFFSKTCKYFAIPENIGCNSKLPERFTEYIENKLKELL